MFDNSYSSKAINTIHLKLLSTYQNVIKDLKESSKAKNKSNSLIYILRKGNKSANQSLNDGNNGYFTKMKSLIHIKLIKKMKVKKVQKKERSKEYCP
ncbi:23157_t:CDS:2 [Dentiscutata erythropus]|uniref:23157_t:CDS:1 n=1 Tax=Dentiscutata erythropus TaxID=1348616 RepID=A0A9N9G5G6_9GLOM|nr:23157_t:CDS:2 [Dentiscutata erythropus]